MQNSKLLFFTCILFTFIICGISNSFLAYSQTNTSQPQITEIKIPNIMNMTLDKKIPINALNISYVFNNQERYVLINITQFNQNNLVTDDCIRSEESIKANETAYQCIFKDPTIGTSSVFCNTNTADCVQPSSRHA